MVSFVLEFSRLHSVAWQVYKFAVHVGCPLLNIFIVHFYYLPVVLKLDLKKQPDHMKGFKKKKLQKFSNWLFSGNRAEMSGTLSHFTIGLMLCLAPELKRRANYLNIEYV